MVESNAGIEGQPLHRPCVLRVDAEVPRLLDQAGVRRGALRQLILYAVVETVGDIVGAWFLRLRAALLPVIETTVPEIAETDLERMTPCDIRHRADRVPRRAVGVEIGLIRGSNAATAIAQSWDQSALFRDVDQVDERVISGIERVELATRSRPRFDEQPTRERRRPAKRQHIERAVEEIASNARRRRFGRNGGRRVRTLTAVLAVVETADLVLWGDLPGEPDAATGLRRIRERRPRRVGIVDPGRQVHG